MRPLEPPVDQGLPAGRGPTFFSDLESGEELVAFDGQAMIPASGYSEIQKLLSSDGTDSSYMGHYVAVDGNVAVVGAQGGDSNRGGAYIFEVQDGSWTEVAKLTASDGAEEDYFGYSVSISGETVLIGAPWDDDHGGDLGQPVLLLEECPQVDDADHDVAHVEEGVDREHRAEVEVGERLDEDRSTRPWSVMIDSSPAIRKSMAR